MTGNHSLAWAEYHHKVHPYGLQDAKAKRRFSRERRRWNHADKVFFLAPLIVLFFLMGRLMTSFLPSTGRSLDCLLPEPGLMPQSLSSEVSDVRPMHLDSTESADPLLGMLKLLPIRVIFQNIMQTR